MTADDITAPPKVPCQVERLCPKCGGAMDQLRYVPPSLPGCAHHDDPHQTEIVTDEHLHRSCRRCGYSSWEPCWSAWVTTRQAALDDTEVIPL